MVVSRLVTPDRRVLHVFRDPLLRAVAASALLSLLPAPTRAASFPPELHFRSVSTPRVTVHYHQDLEALARRAAALADEILAGHERRYAQHMGRVHIVLVDVEDDPNEIGRAHV